MKAGDRYRHYKGRFYTIVEPDVTHEPTMERLVLYKHDETGQLWARPFKGFEQVIEGNAIPIGTRRFTRVD